MTLKLTFGVLAFLAFTAGVFAQTPSIKVHVGVSGSTSINTQLVLLISANEHFTLVTDHSDDVLLQVTCTEPPVAAFGTKPGAQLPHACAVNVIYDHYGILGLNVNLGSGPYVMADFGSEGMAAEIYALLLLNTTPDEIASAQADLSTQAEVLLAHGTVPADKRGKR
jgi:hypothetical protein